VRVTRMPPAGPMPVVIDVAPTGVVFVVFVSGVVFVVPVVANWPSAPAGAPARRCMILRV
jgi:hypothetical protein